MKTKPSVKGEKVEKIDPKSFIVSVKEPPGKGKANTAILKALAEYFQILKSQIRIIFGHTSRQKVVEVESKEGLRQVSICLILSVNGRLAQW